MYLLCHREFYQALSTTWVEHGFFLNLMSQCLTNEAVLDSPYLK